MERFFGYARRLSTGAPVGLATVTVYLPSTVTLATIYDDDLATPTPKANPFTADANGFFYFYALRGRYDVRFSGTSAIPSPYTWGGIGLPSSTGKNIVNVKDCGAAGDGVTDDSVAVRGAITRLSALTTGILYFPPGTYMFSANANQAPLIFSGLSNFLVVGNGATCKYVDGTLINISTAAMFSFRNCHNFIVEGLIIDGNRTNQTNWSEFNHGISIGDDPLATGNEMCTNSVVRRCTISNVAGDCILISSNSRDTWIMENILSNPNQGGAGNARMGLGVVACNRLWILNNRFTGSGALVPGRMAIDLEPSVGSENILSVFIRGNLMDSTDWNRSVSIASGATSQWGTITIDNNIFTRYILYAPGNASVAGYAFIRGNNVSENIIINRCLRADVSGNICSGKDFDGQRDALISVENVAEGATVRGNRMINSSGVTITSGLLVRGNTKRCSVTGNVIMSIDAPSLLTHGVRFETADANDPNIALVQGNTIGTAGGTMTNMVSVAGVTGLKASNLIHVGQNVKFNCTNEVDDATRAYQSTAAWT